MKPEGNRSQGRMHGHNSRFPNPASGGASAGTRFSAPRPTPAASSYSVRGTSIRSKHSIWSPGLMSL